MRDDDSATGRKTGPAKAGPAPEAPPEAPTEQCDWCGSTDLWWRNCKLLCRNCSAIVKSCADL
jgi:hypothetical protein